MNKNKMTTLQFMKIFSIAALLAVQCCLLASADALNIETDYRIRGVSYTNNDFDKSTSGDARSYISQRVNLAIIGNFRPNIEIGTKLTALGIAGGSKTAYAIHKDTTPYIRTDLSPYVENAYLRIRNLLDMPIDISIGKQNLEFGDGLIIADNGIGYFAFHAAGRYPKPFPWQAEIFTAKLQDNITPKSDRNLYGGQWSSTIEKLPLPMLTITKKLPFLKYKPFDIKLGGIVLEVSYFEDRDFSGAAYRHGSSTGPITSASIVKKFYCVRIGKKEKLMEYQFKIVKQGGLITNPNNSTIGFNGLGYVVSGKLIGEKTKLGKVTARALLAINSGDEDPADNTDQKFSPNLTKKYDGLERVGYGKLFAATPQDSFFKLPDSYSGINTLSVGADFSPIYGWIFDVTYFLFSACQAPKGSPTASGFERIFGAEYAMGIEMDLSAKYIHSKYVDATFSFSRYTPPKLEGFSNARNPAVLYQLEINTRF